MPEAAVVTLRRHFALQRMHGERFAIDEHEVAVHADLVRVRARRHRQFGEQLRLFRVFDVDDLRAVRVTHVPDVSNLVLDHDLAAAGAIVPIHCVQTVTVVLHVDVTDLADAF